MKKYRQKRRIREKILDGLIERKNNERTKPVSKNSNGANQLMSSNFSPDQQEAIKFSLIPDEVLEQPLDPDVKDWNLSELKYIKNICRLVLGVFRCTDVGNIKLAWSLLGDKSLPCIDITGEEMQSFMIQNYPRVKAHLQSLMDKERFSEKQIAQSYKKLEAMMRSFGLANAQKSTSSTLVYAPVEPQALVSKIGNLSEMLSSHIWKLGLSGVGIETDIVKSFWGRIREKMDNYVRHDYPTIDKETEETNFLTQPNKKPRRNIAPRYVRRPDCAKLLSQVLHGIQKPAAPKEEQQKDQSSGANGFLSSLTTDFHFTLAEFKKCQQLSDSVRKFGSSTSGRATEAETPTRVKALIPGRSGLANSSGQIYSQGVHSRSQEMHRPHQPSFKEAYDIFNSRARVIGPRLATPTIPPPLCLLRKVSWQRIIPD